jgi:hypothetical protein
VAGVVADSLAQLLRLAVVVVGVVVHMSARSILQTYCLTLYG